MATEVIVHTQGCLVGRFGAVPPACSPPPSCRQDYGTPNPSSCHWRRDSKRSPRSALRRGHETKGSDQRRRKMVSADGRKLTEEVRFTNLKTAISLGTDVYAGSAFSQSPAPSSLPLPTFSRRKEGSEIVDDAATKDLMRLLRIG